MKTVFLVLKKSRSLDLEKLSAGLRPCISLLSMASLSLFHKKKPNIEPRFVRPAPIKLPPLVVGDAKESLECCLTSLEPERPPTTCNSRLVVYVDATTPSASIYPSKCKVERIWNFPTSAGSLSNLKASNRLVKNHAGHTCRAFAVLGYNEFHGWVLSMIGSFFAVEHDNNICIHLNGA